MKDSEQITIQLGNPLLSNSQIHNNNQRLSLQSYKPPQSHSGIRNDFDQLESIYSSLRDEKRNKELEIVSEQTSFCGNSSLDSETLNVMFTSFPDNESEQNSEDFRETQDRELDSEINKLSAIIGSKPAGNPFQQTQSSALTNQKSQVFEYHQQKNETQKYLWEYVINKCKEHGLVSNTDQENMPTLENKNHIISILQLLDKVFSQFHHLQSQIAHFENEAEKEVRQLNQLDRSNKILLEGKYYSRKLIVSLENNYVRMQVENLQKDIIQLQSRNQMHEVQRQEIESKYSELIQKYSNQISKDVNNSHFGVDKEDDHSSSAYKLKVAQLLDLENSIQCMPEKISQLLKEQEQLKLKAMSDQQTWLLQNQVFEYERFKRQCILILDAEQESSLSTLLKKIREYKLAADNNEKNQKVLN